LSSTRPILVLVVDRAGAGRPDLVRDAVRAGVDWVQLRDRTLEARELIELTDEVMAAATPARVVVNRRSDIALAAGADGVHLGFDGMAPDLARALLGSRALVGVSAHAPEEIDAGSGASYAHLAPIFEPLSKPRERAPLGLSALAAAARRGLPVIAQGGLDAQGAGAAIEVGAAGVAVTGAILNADDPARAARALRDAIDEANLA
jgi:thiamine-phosphate pyrophosphorylase